MTNWEDVFTSAKGFAVNAGRKMTDMADVVGLKLELAEQERGLREVMEALGRIVYDSQKVDCNPDRELVAGLVEQADAYEKAIQRLQSAIDELCSRKTCACGAVNPGTASYCNACGNKL